MPDPDDNVPQEPDAVLTPGGVPEVGPDLGGLLGGLDIGSLLGMASEMQQQLADAQAAAEATMVEGAAGGGMVKVSVTGGGEFRSVVIDRQVVDPDDVEMLQDLVLAALHDAMAQVHELHESSGGAGAAALSGMPDLGSLGDLFGGAG